MVLSAAGLYLVPVAHDDWVVSAARLYLVPVVKNGCGIWCGWLLGGSLLQRELMMAFSSVADDLNS